MSKKDYRANSRFIGRTVLIPGLSSIDLTGKIYLNSSQRFGFAELLQKKKDTNCQTNPT